MRLKTESFQHKKRVFNMKIFNRVSGWRKYKKQNITSKKTIGFVPTMGALHPGHLSLINKSKKENSLTLVSIFINKTQFNDKNDYEKYPQKTEEDIIKLKKASVDFLLLPKHKELYSDNYRFKVTENSFSNIMEGKHRSGHFDGVLTVVMKLLIGIMPSVAYFGEKDYQQYTLISDMAKSFLLETKIISCPTVRKSNGLAESSRNSLLSRSALKHSSKLYNELKTSKSPTAITNSLKSYGFDVEYIEEHNGRNYGAVYFENVRLIDNVKKKHTI